MGRNSSWRGSTLFTLTFGRLRRTSPLGPSSSTFSSSLSGLGSSGRQIMSRVSRKHWNSLISCSLSWARWANSSDPIRLHSVGDPFCSTDNLQRTPHTSNQCVTYTHISYKLLLLLLAPPIHLGVWSIAAPIGSAHSSGCVVNGIAAPITVYFIYLAGELMCYNKQRFTTVLLLLHNSCAFGLV